MEIITLFLPMLLGCVLGLFVGIVPGIGTSTVLIIIYPFLLDFNLPQLFSFYSCILIVSQYCGSVSAILLGIPGEITSLPAVKEGYRFEIIGQGKQAIQITAIYSFIGGLFALVLFYLLLIGIDHIFIVYQNKFQLAFLTLCIVCVTFLCNNKVYVNFALLLIGGFLGKIGYNEFMDTEFMTFDNHYLSLGLPLYAILIFLYVVPTLFLFYHEEKVTLTAKQKLIKIGKQTQYFGVAMYSSAVGFLTGLIPGTSYVMSSQLAWGVEKIRLGKKYQMPCASALVAAETSNNSAIVSTLIPLLLFAVPITVSEAIIYNIATVGANFWTLGWLYDTHNQLVMLGGFFVANTFGLLVAWPFARRIISFVKSRVKYFIWIILALLIGIFLYHGHQNIILSYYIVLAVILFPTGWMLRKQDMIPLVIGFVIQERYELVLRILGVQLGL